MFVKLGESYTNFLGLKNAFEAVLAGPIWQFWFYLKTRLLPEKKQLTEQFSNLTKLFQFTTSKAEKNTNTSLNTYLKNIIFNGFNFTQLVYFLFYYPAIQIK